VRSGAVGLSRSAAPSGFIEQPASELPRTPTSRSLENKDSLTVVLASHRLSFLVLSEPDLTRLPHGTTLYL
jgi:hypothetical protein